MFVSVIIPVYRPGRFVRGCIDSLRRQSFADFEAIFIDDCGDDGSIQIIRQIAESDNRFKILHNRENRGQGASRDAGIAIAEGEYVLMLDSDDRLADHALSTLYNAAQAEDVDIIAFSVVHKYRFSRRIYPDFRHKYRAVGRDFLQPFMSGINQSFALPNVEWFECNKLIRRNLIINNNITHLAQRRRCEDLPFLLELFAAAKNVLCIPEKLYFYNKCNPNAVTADTSLDGFASSLLPFHTAQKFLLDNGLHHEFGNQFLCAWDKYVYMGILAPQMRFFDDAHNRKVVADLVEIIKASPMAVPHTLALFADADPKSFRQLKTRLFKMRCIPLWLTKLKKKLLK